MANQFSVNVPSIDQAFASGQEGYSSIRKLMQERQQESALSAAADAIKAGDNNALMEALFKAHQIGPAIEVAKLERQQSASKDFATSLGGIFGGQQQPSPSLPPTSPVARLMTPDQPSEPATPRPSSNLTAPGTEVLGVDYGPVTNPSGAVVAQGAGYVPGDPASSRAAPQAAPQPLQRGAPQIGPSPSLAGVSLDKAVPVLLQAASNPSLPKEQQETARMLLGKAFDQYPQQIRELEIFKQRPDLFQMAKDLKNAGATVINTAEGMDAAQTKARIDIDKHAVQDLSKKVASGRAAVPLLNQMMAINDKTPGGWAGAAAPYLAKAAASFGIEVPEGASNAELFGAISRQFVPSVRDPGATSNYEQSLYMQAVPSLSQSQEGRAKIATMMRSQIDRNAEMLAIYRQYVGRPELDAKLAELDNKPMFSPADRKYLETVASNTTQNNVGNSQPRVAPDGKSYIPDPKRPGKYLRVD